MRSGGDRSGPENDLIQLSDIQAEAEAQVQHQIDTRKEQHKRWNQLWIDRTWRPITPPLDDADEKPRWAPLLSPGTSYPTPPPTLPSEGSQDRDEDVEMQDGPAIKQEEDAVAGATPEPDFIFHIPGAFPMDQEPLDEVKRGPTPACRLRYGRGGRCFLEARRKQGRALISTGVVSDSESDEEDDATFFPVDPQKVFDYRCAVNITNRSRPEGMTGERRHHGSGDQSSMAVPSGGQQSPNLQRQTSGGSAG